MIPKKIKAVRELLGITETQVSSTINVNSYKYKKSEGDAAYLSTEILILLSIIYKVPFGDFLLDEISKDDILKSEYLNCLKGLGKEQIEVVLKDNLCSYFAKKRRKANTTTIDLILRSERKLFGVKLKDIREQKQMDIPTVSKLLEIQDDEYKYFESGSSLPNLSVLIRIIKRLDVSINDLISL